MKTMIKGENTGIFNFGDFDPETVGSVFRLYRNQG